MADITNSTYGYHFFELWVSFLIMDLYKYEMNSKTAT